MNLQPAATAATVLFALIVILRRLPWFRKSSQTACGACGGCSRRDPSGPDQMPLVQLGSGASGRTPQKS